MGEEYNITGILTDDEVSDLFSDDTEETKQETPPEETEKQEENKEETTETESTIDELFDESESVGSGQENKQDDKEGTTSEKDSTSPKNNFYSSIASALKEDGIFPNLDNDIVEKASTAEDFYDIVEQQVQSMLDEKQRRVDEALTYGVPPSQIKLFENNISFLKGLSEDMITAETEEGEKLRRELISFDYRNRGYSEERANREVEKSFSAASDIEDAKEALKSNLEFYTSRYDELRNEAKQKDEEEKEAKRKEAETLKKSILNDKESFKDFNIDIKTRNRIYDVVSKPTYKDPDTDEYLTEIQKYEKENPVEFRKNLGMLYVLTEGFKNIDKLVQPKVKEMKKKGLRDLEGTLNSTTRNSDGSLRLATGTQGDTDESYFGKGWTFDV